MKVVRVLGRDRRGRPLKAAIGEESSPIEIVVERWATEWQPTYIIKNGEAADLPSSYQLNRETLEALDNAT